MARLEKLPTCILIELDSEDRILEVGRQTGSEPPPLAVIKGAELTRLVVATKDETVVGRKQLLIEVLSPTRVRLTNKNENNRILLPTDSTLGFGESEEVTLPTRVARSNVQLRIEMKGAHVESAPDEAFESMAEPPDVPGSSVVRSPKLSPTFFEESIIHSIRDSNTDAMLKSLSKLIAVLQKAASSTDFEVEIARTAIEMVYLDRAAVVKFSQGEWINVGSADLRGNTNEKWRPSQRMLSRLLEKKLTIWGAPGKITSSVTDSVATVMSVVAAPIRNPAGDVIGAVYGDRRLEFGSERPPIDKLDARLVEIMATGVAGGWARMEQERAVAAKRAQFEQFVTKEVAQEIEKDPNALIGRNAEVTMLFCDIAGFSRISEQMTPQKAFEWINAVMKMLSTCVLATKGTLVDYVGDELIAMWGAPLTIEDHATCAARTAIMMLESLKTFNEQYTLPHGEQTQIGIGLNSGAVRVGNTGSEYKLKYGPLGSEVNIASRVQGATRYLRTPALITGATAKRLSGEFFTRRLCSVRLKNIDDPVELFELTSNRGPTWNHIVENYELALKAWEQHKLQSAIESLSQVISKVSQDGPTMVLLARAVDVWSRDQHDYDPVWTLPSK